MAYWWIGFLIVVVLIGIFKKIGVTNPYSKGAVILVFLSLTAAVVLGQNYTQSLIPEANDGIGVSNSFAYFLIGKGEWTQELFHRRFEQSIYAALSAIVLYSLAVILESRPAKKIA
ncbi:hypothetical protein [Paenibacillus sp. NPDC058071]|uniref:hypothetical protein n=1 Tax=Paenibacillus sp. NPDC058071 TaxID=3346326 RepID=UPI0036D954EA